MKNSPGKSWIKSYLPRSGPRVEILLAILKFIPRQVDLIVIAAMAFVLVHGRWLSMVYPFPLNPDEAQAAANALRIKAYGFDWSVLDGSTNGPLDSLATCWPYLFGLDVTLNTARLTACILLLLVCVFVYLSIKLLCGRMFAVLLVLPLVIFYAFVGSPNFIHYSSELLPTFLLVAAYYFSIEISINRARPHRFRYIKFALLGLILGAVPFAKLQGAPIAVVMALYAFILAITAPSEGRLRNSIALICGGMAPAFAFLFPLLVTGHIHDFWRSYIVWAFFYVKDPLSILTIHSMIAGNALLRPVSYFIFSLGFLSLLHSSLIRSDENAAVRATRYDVIYGLALVITAFWVVAKPGNDFAHYLMFLPPFAVIFCAYVARAFTDRRRDVLLFLSYYVVLAGIFTGLFLTTPAPRYYPRDWHNTSGRYIQQSLKVRSPHILSWLPIPSTHLLVWGWMPQWYVWSDLTPASRETVTYSQIVDSPLQGYFRSRFMSDIGASSPDIIMDAVEGGSFAFRDPSQAGPGVFPEFEAYLSRNYTQLEPWQPEPDCPKLYIKKEFKALVDSRLITPAAVTTSANYLGDHSAFTGARLFDNSVTEDTCIDFWLLPNWTRGSVDVTFSKVEQVSSLMILNTANSAYLDRATNGIEIELLKAGVVVSEKKLTMKPYPYWTTVDFDAPVSADQLQVNILSYFGHGGGLNEIKIFRADGSGKASQAPGSPGG